MAYKFKCKIPISYWVTNGKRFFFQCFYFMTAKYQKQEQILEATS